MGMDRGYTAALLKPGKASAEEIRVARHSAVGRAFCCPVVAWLCDRGLQRAFPHYKAASDVELRFTGVAPAPWSDRAVFHEGEGDTEESRQLVREYNRLAE